MKKKQGTRLLSFRLREDISESKGFNSMGLLPRHAADWLFVPF